MSNRARKKDYHDDETSADDIDESLIPANDSFVGPKLKSDAIERDDLDNGAAGNKALDNDVLGIPRATIWDRVGLSRQNRYILAAILNLLIIWGGALSFIFVTPDQFVSNFTLLIPGAGAGSSLNLDNLGQASSSVNSAYSSAKVDPKTNYKAIAMSPVVLGLAADALDIPVKDFGRPKVKLIDQTTLLEVSLTANSEQAAYDKSVEYHKAIETTLTQLRANELAKRRKANESVLSQYQESVNQAQSAVLEFQQESAIVLPEQFGNLVLNVESLKQRRAEADVKLQSIKAHLEALQDSLNINSRQAANALKLHNDSLFASLVELVSSSTAELVESQAVWGRNHPKVMHAQARVDTAKQALLNRSYTLTGLDNRAALNNLYISGEGSRSQLFQSVISLTAEKSATESEINSYLTQLTKLEDQTHRNASLAAKLQDLERTHQVATAIYVSAAAKTDLGNSDIYASYPMTQVLMEPTRPNGPEKFIKPIALTGAAIGSLLICLALLISWKRSVLLQKLQKRS